MDKRPLITTLIPTHRRPHLLKKALQSVLSQTFSDFQISVLDNNSQDETEEIVRKMGKQDPRIHYCPSHSLLPAAANFQRGLDSIETPYFSILSDDDLLLPTFYETALYRLDQSPSSFFFMGSVIDCEENGTVIHESARQWPDLRDFSPPAGIYEIIPNYVNWTGSLFRKEIAKTLAINQTITAIDFDFVLRAAMQYPFTFSKNPCALFIQHPRSYSNHCGAKLVWPGSLKTLETLLSMRVLTPLEKTKIESLMKEYLERSLFRIALRSVSRGELVEVDKIGAIFHKELKNTQIFCVLKTLLFFCKSRPMLQIIQKAYRFLINTKRKRWKVYPSGLKS